MLSQQTNKSTFTPHQTRLWLSWLAKQMQHQGVTEFYFEHLQPNWLPTLELRFIYNAITALLAGLLVGPLFGVLTGAITGLFTKSPIELGLLAGLIAGLLFGTSQHRPVEIIGWKWRYVRESASLLIIIGLLSGLFAGLVVGLLTGLFDGLVLGLLAGLLDGGLVLMLVVLLAGLREYHPLETISWKWGHVRTNFVSLLLIELLIGPLIGLFTGLLVEPFVGVLAGIFAEVFMGLSVGFSSDQLDPQRLTIPNYSLQRARHNGFLFALLSGLSGSLLVGLLTGLLFDVLTGLLTGLFFGLLMGLLMGLLFGLGAILHQQKLLIFLRCLGAIPKDYVRFLDYAAERILLQKIGGGYSFIHRLLLDFFASLDLSAVMPQGNEQKQSKSSATVTNDKPS